MAPPGLLSSAAGREGGLDKGRGGGAVSLTYAQCVPPGRPSAAEGGK